jgi:glycosyltransferase involved in cell wall biosynthesis
LPGLLRSRSLPERKGSIRRQSGLPFQDDPRLLALNTVACSVAPGAGGLGRHFGELIGLAQSSALPSFRYIYPAPSPHGPAHIPVRPMVAGGDWLNRIPCQWVYPAFIDLAARAFDLSAARKLERSRLGFTSFACHALFSFRKARRAGISYLGLAAPNSHVDNLWRQQQIARSQYSLDRGWLTDSLRKRTLREYALADVVFVTSEYERASFLSHGVDEEKLLRVDLTPDPRFRRRTSPPPMDTFNIAYVGRFDLIKGVPVLLDAFSAVARPEWRLTLMGQFASRGLRRYVEARVAQDSRIKLLGYGDPLPVLESSHVFVHPAFEDGFGYAPMEALAMGVPVIVTDQTGMAEHVEEGVSGSIVPAGDVDRLAERLRAYSASRDVPSE